MGLQPRSLIGAIFRTCWMYWMGSFLLLGFIVTMPIDAENFRLVPLAFGLAVGMFAITLSIALTKTLYILRHWVFGLEFTYVGLNLYKLLRCENFRWSQVETASFVAGRLCLCLKDIPDPVELDLDPFSSHEINLWSLLLEVAQMHQFSCTLDDVTYCPETYP